MSAPVISLQTITGTFDGTRDQNRDRILSSELVEFLGDEQPGASVLSLVLNVEGEIHPEGLEVFISSDGDFSQYFARLGRPPFSIGGEVVEAVYSADGTPAGFKVLVTGPNALFSFTGAQTDIAETDGSESLTFSLEEGAGFSVDENSQTATVTFYDTLAAVPPPTSTPTVGISIDNTELVEAAGDAVTLTFHVDGEIPDQGMLVYVDSGVRGAVGEFNIFNADVSGGVFPAANFLSSGFYFKLFEDGASIRLTVFDETLNPQIDPEDATEGIEDFTFSLVEGPGYAIDTGAGSVSYTIADAADSVPLDRAETAGDSGLPGDSESNDTLETAVATRLGEISSFVEIAGSLDQQRFPPVDRTEDVDLYSVVLSAGDVVRADIDARSQFDNSPDTVLRLFNANGDQVAQNDDGYAPGELFSPGRQDSYLEFTAETAGTYYLGISSFGNGAFEFWQNDDGTLNNRPYDPTVAGSGTGRSFGQYQLNLSLNQVPRVEATEIPAATVDGPTVSLTATPGTYSRDDNILANALVQFVEDRSGSILSLELGAEGEIPEAGIDVYLVSNIDLSSVFSTRLPFSPIGAEVQGAVYDASGTPVGLRIKLNDNRAIVNLNLNNADKAPTNGAETVTFTLMPSAGYRVGDDSFSTIVYDTVTDVPALAPEPTVGISVSETALVESEGNRTTLTFILDAPPPAGGVLVNVDSGVRSALGEFDIFNADVVGGNFPVPNFQASGFFFQMTEQTATITLAAFDETTNPQILADAAVEGIEEISFALQSGTGYVIAPDASEVTVTIADSPDAVAADGESELAIPPAIPFEEEFNDTLADATDTNLNIDSPHFMMQAEINSTRITGNLIDATEDVDMYAFTLQAGDTVQLDIDSIPYEIKDTDREQRVDTELRIFNQAGEELVFNAEAPAPGELFESGRDAYVEFTAAQTGTYYAGVALLSNRDYDPNLAGSGSGRVFPQFGINTGEYTLDATLMVNDANVASTNRGETTLNRGGAENTTPLAQSPTLMAIQAPTYPWGIPDISVWRITAVSAVVCLAVVITMMLTRDQRLRWL